MNCRSLVWPRAARSVGSEQGSTAVEFAIVGSLFFALLLGIIESGRAIWTYDTAAHAAREGTRWAIVRGADSGRAANASQVEAYVRSRATGMDQVNVTTTWDPDGVCDIDNTPGCVVQVRVDIPFRPVVPLLPGMTLTGTSRMVISF
jgi:Flp pilus assembly protein TadG